MFSFVKNIRFYSTIASGKLRLGFVNDASKASLRGNFRKGGLDILHPVLTKFDEEVETHCVLLQGTSVSTPTNPAELIDNDFNMVGENKAQYGVVPHQKVCFNNNQFSPIKGSEKFIEQNGDRVIDIVKSKNPGLLNENDTDSDVD